MDCVSFVVGFFSGILVGIVGNLFYDCLKSYAGRRLLGGLAVRPMDAPRRADNEGFWLVELLVGRGDWLTKMFGERATVEIHTLVRFDGNGTSVRGSAFKVHSGVINKYDMHDTFEITQNSRVALAVVRRSSEDNKLYHFGGFAADTPLDKTYDATIVIQDKKERTLSEHTIKSYIRDGNVVIDEENAYEV